MIINKVTTFWELTFCILKKFKLPFQDGLACVHVSWGTTFVVATIHVDIWYKKSLDFCDFMF